jgi:protein-tyrosine phosphatase
MIDVHCHILPGLDDGPENIETSLAMAESAIADGITHVVATPHSSNEYFFDYPRVRALRTELQERIGDRLILATGCDFHLNPENLDALREDAPRFCINQRDCLLVEFNEYSIPPAMDQTLHGDNASGAQRHTALTDRAACEMGSARLLHTSDCWFSRRSLWSWSAKGCLALDDRWTGPPCG